MDRHQNSKWKEKSEDVVMKLPPFSSPGQEDNIDNFSNERAKKSI